MPLYGGGVDSVLPFEPQGIVLFLQVGVYPLVRKVVQLFVVFLPDENLLLFGQFDVGKFGFLLFPELFDFQRIFSVGSLLDGGQPQGDILLLLVDALKIGRGFEFCDVQFVLLLFGFDHPVDCGAGCFRQILFGLQPLLQILDFALVAFVLRSEVFCRTLGHQGYFGIESGANVGKLGF